MSKSKTPGSGKESLYTGSYRQTSEACEHQDLISRQDIPGPTGDTSIGALNHEGLINNSVKNAHSDSGRELSYRPEFKLCFSYPGNNVVT